MIDNFKIVEADKAIAFGRYPYSIEVIRPNIYDIGFKNGVYIRQTGNFGIGIEIIKATMAAEPASPLAVHIHSLYQMVWFSAQRLRNYFGNTPGCYAIQLS